MTAGGGIFGVRRARECCPDEVADAALAGMGQSSQEQLPLEMSLAFFPCLVSPLLSGLCLLPLGDAS